MKAIWTIDTKMFIEVKEIVATRGFMQRRIAHRNDLETPIMPSQGFVFSDRPVATGHAGSGNGRNHRLLDKPL